MSGSNLFGNGAGSSGSGVVRGTIFHQLRLALQVTAEAYPAPPTDLVGTPENDVWLFVEYPTGERLYWHYKVSDQTYSAVEASVVS